MAEVEGQQERSRRYSPAEATSPEAAALPAPTNRLLMLQHTVGNQAVQRLVRTGALPPRAILDQQRTLGNRAVQRLLGVRSRQVEPLPAPVPVSQSASASSVARAEMSAPVSPMLQRQPRRERVRDFEQVRQLLNQIPSGRAALALMTRHRIGTRLAAGVGTFFDPAANTMVIDSAFVVAEAAAALIHEITHARYHHEGRTADIMALSRDEYVRRMIEEEAESVVKELEAKAELRGAGVDVSTFTSPLERQYQRAYQRAVTALRRRSPSAAEAELDQAGREAGRQRVIQGFRRGEVTTSNTNESYPQYYGRAWDRAHPRR